LGLAGPAPRDVAGLVRLGRPVVWEVGDDPVPAPWVPGAPVGWIGAPGLPLDAQIAAAERAFAPPATDHQGGAETPARVLVDLGALASRVRDFPRGVALTERALTLGDDPLARLNLARYLLALGDVPRAQKLAEAALRGLPRRADAWSLLGVID